MSPSKTPRGISVLGFITAVVSVALVGLTGCAGAPSVLDPASPEASRIADLFWGVLIVAAIVFVGVEAVLLYAVVRFRSRAGAPVPPQTHGNLPLETAWTLVPALVLTAVFVAMVSAMFSLTEQPATLRVQVAGQQWFWDIRYPDQQIVTATDLHVPVGQTVEVELTANDVIHSFWVPQLAGKTDAIPGHTNLVRFTARTPGVYRGLCGEFCGVQHANMGFLVIAEPPEQFEAWVQQMQTAPAVPTTGDAARGAQAFLQTQPCWTCHTVQGTRAQANAGPDLTHFASRRTIASVTLDNTPENLARWLENPQDVKPGNKMIVPRLSRETIQDLVAFLQTLK